MAVKRRNKSVYISVYSYIIPAFWLKNPVFPGVFVSTIDFLNDEGCSDRADGYYKGSFCTHEQ